MDRGRGGTQRPVTGGDASSNRVNLSQSRSTLYVRNLPPEKLTMPEISQYFSKFGTVTNIQLRPATNPDRYECADRNKSYNHDQNYLKCPRTFLNIFDGDE